MAFLLLGVTCKRLALHAEQNAILYVSKNGVSIEGSTLYVTLSPCISCARTVLIMKIEKVLFLHSCAKYKGIPNDEGVDFLRKFGVRVEQYQGNLVPDRELFGLI